jgi:hypothetical protein
MENDGHLIQGTVISSNLKTRLDGLPRADQRAPEDPGVALYLHFDGNEICIPCDRYDKVAQNMAAIAASIESMRRLERHGSRQIMGAAFSGFKMIADKTSGFSWYDVLAVKPDASFGFIRERYRVLAQERHPDHTGETGPWFELQEAYKQAKDVHGV